MNNTLIVASDIYNIFEEFLVNNFPDVVEEIDEDMKEAILDEIQQYLVESESPVVVL